MSEKIYTKKAEKKQKKANKPREKRVKLSYFTSDAITRFKNQFFNIKNVK
jgi:hypothetical protein